MYIYIYTKLNQYIYNIVNILLFNINLLNNNSIYLYYISQNYHI